MVGSALITLGNLILVIGATFPEWSRTWFIIGLGVCGIGGAVHTHLAIAEGQACCPLDGVVAVVRVVVVVLDEHAV